MCFLDISEGSEQTWSGFAYRFSQSLDASIRRAWKNGLEYSCYRFDCDLFFELAVRNKEFVIVLFSTLYARLT